MFRTTTRALFRVPADGSAPATEIRLPDGTPADIVSYQAMKITADGARVVFPTDGRLFSAPLAGGATVELGAELSDYDITLFDLSPSGSRVAFAALSSANEVALYTVAAAGGLANPVLGDGPISQFRFAALGDRILFTSQLAGDFTQGLFVGPASGGQGVLISGSHHVTTFAGRADDQLAGFVNGHYDLYVTPLDGSTLPQRVNEVAGYVASFVLGLERAFYLAAPNYWDYERTELYSRTYASLP